MLGKIFHFDISESSQPYMQCYFCFFDAFDLDLLHQPFAEVKSCRWCCYSPYVFCKYRLKTFIIDGFSFAFEDLWQGCISQTIEDSFEFFVTVFKIKADRPSAAGCIVDYFRNKVLDRTSTRLNSSHVAISYAVYCF